MKFYNEGQLSDSGGLSQEKIEQILVELNDDRVSAENGQFIVHNSDGSVSATAPAFSHIRVQSEGSQEEINMPIESYLNALLEELDRKVELE